MKCTLCSEKAVYDNQGTRMCKKHFLRYFENKVFKTIKKYSLIDREDNVCIATSGGKDSLAVLYCTAKYCRKNNINFFALAIDEGIKGYRDKTLDDLEIFCKEYDVDIKQISFKKRFGATLDQIREKAMIDHGKKPCTVCGIMRRTLLNRGSREFKATKIVTGHNLDDESQTFMMNILQGNMEHNAKMGPITGIKKNKGFVPRIKPLYFISEKETRLFCFLKGFKVDFSECPNITYSFRAQVRDKLNELENIRPGCKNGIVNSFLAILDDLKEKYSQDSEFDECEKCGDPCSGKTCSACQLEELLCKKVE
jgi:uncharacterized protein (TIGR00269 family)